jgi:hypothetical protein
MLESAAAKQADMPLAKTNTQLAVSIFCYLNDGLIRNIS